MQRRGVQIAIAACVAVATILVYELYSLRPRPSVKEISDAQDKVYEAVVRDLIAPPHGQPEITQLVFGAALLTSGADPESCKADVKQFLHVGAAPLPFNSVADKIHRLVTRSGDDYFIRPDAVRSFSDRYCAGGRLSETFRTDLPRTFVNPQAVYFGIVPPRKNGPIPFKQLFPGAPGIISFSGVSFDSRLSQAVVFTTFECGMLCGSGHIYVLQQTREGWRVTDKWLVWVS